MAKRLNQRWLRKQSASLEDGQEAFLYDTLYISLETTNFVISLLETGEITTEPIMVRSMKSHANDINHFLKILTFQLEEAYPDANIWSADEIDIHKSKAIPPIKLN